MLSIVELRPTHHSGLIPFFFVTCEYLQDKQTGPDRVKTFPLLEEGMYNKTFSLSTHRDLGIQLYVKVVGPILRRCPSFRLGCTSFVPQVPFFEILSLCVIDSSTTLSDSLYTVAPDL